MNGSFFRNISHNCQRRTNSSGDHLDHRQSKHHATHHSIGPRSDCDTRTSPENIKVSLPTSYKQAKGNTDSSGTVKLYKKLSPGTRGH